MKFQIFSDIHIETRESVEILFDSLTPIADYAIIAGDIDSYNFINTVNYISNYFKKIIVIKGNHDYYHKSINTKLDTHLLNDNVILLDKDTYELNDIIFIGCTLWSDFKNQDWFVMNNAKERINDFKQIKDFYPHTAYNIHVEHKQFIIDKLNQYKDTDKKIVLITHFLPSFDLINDKWKTKKNENLNHYFSANCNNIINEFNDTIKYWIYGHTHDFTKTNLGNINFICNPLGYPFENKQFNNVVIDI